MSTEEERVQMRRVPIDSWSKLELLNLANAVANYGEQNWNIVSTAVKCYGDSNRPLDWYSEKNCAVQYKLLLENSKTPERIPGSETKSNTHCETVLQSIITRLTRERIREVRKQMEEERREYHKLMKEIHLIRSGKLTHAEIDRICAEAEEEDRRDAEEEIAHTQWLQRREERLLEAERECRPVTEVSTQVTGQKRKASDSLGATSSKSSYESEPAQKVSKSALSPVRSLLMTPILHSPIEQSGTVTSPTIPSLLNTTASVSVLPSLQQLDSTAINQESTPAPVASGLFLVSLDKPDVSKKNHKKAPKKKISAPVASGPLIVSLDNPETSNRKLKKDPEKKISAPVVSDPLIVSLDKPDTSNRKLKKDPEKKISAPVVSDPLIVSLDKPDTSNRKLKKDPEKKTSVPVASGPLIMSLDKPDTSAPVFVPTIFNSTTGLGELKKLVREDKNLFLTNISAPVASEPPLVSLDKPDISVLAPESTATVAMRDDNRAPKKQIPAAESLFQSTKINGKTVQVIEPVINLKEGTITEETVHDPENIYNLDNNSQTNSDESVLKKLSVEYTDDTACIIIDLQAVQEHFESVTKEKEIPVDKPLKDIAEPASSEIVEVIVIDDDSNTENNKSVPDIKRDNIRKPMNATESESIYSPKEIRSEEKTNKNKESIVIAEEIPLDEPLKNKTVHDPEEIYDLDNNSKTNNDDIVLKEFSVEVTNDTDTTAIDVQSEQGDTLSVVKEKEIPVDKPLIDIAKPASSEIVEVIVIDDDSDPENYKSASDDILEIIEINPDDSDIDADERDINADDRDINADNSDNNSASENLYPPKEIRSEEEANQKEPSIYDEFDIENLEENSQNDSTTVLGSLNWSEENTAQMERTINDEDGIDYVDEPKENSKNSLNGIKLLDCSWKAAFTSEFSESSYDYMPVEVTEMCKPRKDKRDYSRTRKNDSQASESVVLNDDLHYYSWKKSVMLLHNFLVCHKYASLFLRPVAEEDFPGYHSIVNRPMDLQTIRENIENGVIRTTQEFHRDVVLMFLNALMYNSRNEPEYNMARDMLNDSLQQIDFLLAAEAQSDGPTRRETRTSECQDFSSDADSDEEPCMKQPRLSSDYVVYSSSNQCEDEDVSFTDTGMDINSEPVSVKMVNNGNEHEREINNFEHKAATEDYQNHGENGNDMHTDMKHEHEEHRFGITPTKSVQNLNSSGPTEKSPKDKNTLQKLPVSVEANIGSYYYKHRDTDSELDTNNSIISIISNKDQKREESSEDEFTYCAKSMEVETVQETNNELPDPDKECIQRLVQRVEELVSTPKVDPLMFHTEQQKSKLSRVKEWLNFENDKPIDSCDASGECTSGESEEDKESQSSEDLNDSIVTCRPQQLYDSCLPLDDPHAEELAFTTETCKINLRPKRFQMKGNRPWSVSCLSQFSQISPTKIIPDAIPNFSISESALNNLSGLTPNSVKIRPFNASANSIGVQGNNSTSSTVEESGMMFLNEGAKPISVRKKKIRLRKKHIVRKNESGSESQNYKSPGHTNFTSFSKPHIYTLVKSGSFSGSGSRVVAHERNTASDPSTRPYNGSRGVCDTSTTSGADSEDDKKIQSRLPKFLLGPHAGLVKGYCPPNVKPEDRDSSPEKSSLNTAEEQSSSLSEQAWDNYQEKYLSENYSEAHDSDAARKLLDFGEDYRSYLDSQSDCWSAHSQNHSPQFRRKATIIPQTDSDSEIEDIKQYINESKAQLKYTIDIYEKHVAMELNEFLVSSDCGEIIATCERHIYGLEVVIDANDDTKVLPDVEVMEVKALMSAWMDLKWSAKKMQSSRALYNEVISFKKDLSQYAVNASPLSDIKSKEELTAEIDRLTEVQNVLLDKKRRLLELNVAIHRYIINENTPCYTNLKSEVSDLYTLWNDTCQSVNERMNDLSGHLQVWAQLESRLDELQSDLRSDGQTLRLLDTALNGGVVSMEVATSVRDVAKVLSESKNGSQKYVDASGNQDAAAALFCNRTLSLSLLTEGSFSDSGISDEGSEQELSEREHRLAAIRRLVRHLETIMAPDSEARIKMTQRLEEAENELRKLQSQCRGLIVRTAVCAEVQSQNTNKSSTKRKFSCDLGLVNGKDEFSVGDILCRAVPDGDDPDSNPGNGSWFWRVVRASVPFQVALVALICMACLLEPSCCDNINNLSLSLTPQLRYVRGPPPV